MRLLIAAILSATLAIMAPQQLTAQDAPQPIFDSYAEMRATLDDLMSKRQIADLLTRFGGADEMSLQDMTGLETQVRNLFPEDFENSAVMIRQDLENGFAQEMIAYWTGTAYIYARVLWHERPDGVVVSINMTFNSNPDTLVPLF
jgi:hypothetical protein